MPAPTDSKTPSNCRALCRPRGPGENFARAFLAWVRRDQDRSRGTAGSFEAIGLTVFMTTLHATAGKPPTTSALPLAVTVLKAAELLGLSERTTRLYIARGYLQSFRIGRRRLVPLGALQRLLESAIPGPSRTAR